MASWKKLKNVPAWPDLWQHHTGRQTKSKHAKSKERNGWLPVSSAAPQAAKRDCHCRLASDWNPNGME